MRAVERPDCARETARGTPDWPEPRIRAENFLGACGGLVDILCLFGWVCWVAFWRRWSVGLERVAMRCIGLMKEGGRLGMGNGMT